MIKVLLACSDNAFEPWSTHKHVGRLITPALRTAYVWSEYTAIDNYAYAKWDPTRFFKTLILHSRKAKEIKWVACPDKVGDWEETLERFKFYYKLIAGYGYALAYVLQDGQPRDNIPWNSISAVFLGGTDDWKMCEESYRLCRLAKDLGKLVHIGRVNSVERVSRFLSIADSIDGLSYSKYSRAHLPRLLAYIEEQDI